MSDVEQDFMLFSGSSHRPFAEKMAAYLGVQLGEAKLETFPDEEIFVQIQENVRGRDVFVVQSLAVKPNFYLMELLVMIDALKRASARNVIAVVPYLAYCRQDRKDRARVPITAKLVANLLEKAGASRLLTMDLHTTQIQGFYDMPLDNLMGKVELVTRLQQELYHDLCLVTPDIGSVKLARAFADDLQGSFAIVDKQRIDASNVETAALIGDVSGKEVILVDDICSTAGTLVTAANVCMENGAVKVQAVVTHGQMVGCAIERLEESVIEKLWVSDTIPGIEERDCAKIEVVSVASFFGEAIRRIIQAESISSLFDAPVLC